MTELNTATVTGPLELVKVSVTRPVQVVVRLVSQISRVPAGPQMGNQALKNTGLVTEKVQQIRHENPIEWR